MRYARYAALISTSIALIFVIVAVLIAFLFPDISLSLYLYWFSRGLYYSLRVGLLANSALFIAGLIYLAGMRMRHDAEEQKNAWKSIAIAVSSLLVLWAIVTAIGLLQNTYH